MSRHHPDKIFEVQDWSLIGDGRRIDFQYLCPVYGAFTESLVFAQKPHPLEAPLVRLLHAVMGVSYYKCAASGTLSLPPLTRAERVLVEAAYAQGLGEFFVRNGLDYPYPLTLESRGEAAPRPVGDAAPAAGEALVGYGGGKDSLVAMDVVRRTGVRAAFFKVRVHMGPAMAVPAQDMITIDRFIDPKIRDANAAGALNGHVPVTAINSLTGLLAGLRRGSGSVVFANERSADEATAVVDGHGVNHQFSKGLAMERLIQKATGGMAGVPRYFSVLRPVSEVWIARHLTGLPGALDKFMSCNRNFRIGREGKQVWCGECPKCAFTYLLLSPFVERDRLMEIFGADLLDKTSLMPIYEELTGIAPVKPWECVGTVEECRALMQVAAGDRHWAERTIVAALSPRIEETLPKERAPAALKALLNISPDHAVPDPYLATLTKLGSV